jgi:hypothetical protein
MCIAYDGKYIDKTVNTEFLGLQIDKYLMDTFIYKLIGECYAV